jgi:long-chain fatty acid transport protein
MIISVIPSGVFASGYADTYGVSSKSIGMANAVTAIANDWTSSWYNPAGLGKTYTIKKYAGGSADDEDDDGKSGNEGLYINELAVVMHFALPSMEINIPRDGVYGADNLQFSTVTLGVVVDINKIVKMPDYISSARLGIILGVGLDGWMYKLNDISPVSHNYVRYGREAERTMIVAGAGFGFLNDMFGIGLGANMINSSEATTKISNIQLAFGVQQPMAESKMNTSATSALNAGFYFSVEKLYEKLKGLEFGMGYRMESYMKIHPFMSDTKMLLAGVGIPVALAMYDFYSPHIISTGLAYTRWDVTASMNIDYEMWSLYDFGPAYTKGYLYYDTEGKANYLELPEMQDIVTFRLGFAWDLKRWVSWATAYCGYYYQPYYVPDEAMTGDFNLLDNTRHAVSFGATFDFPKMWRFGGPVEVNFAYQYQYLSERKVKKEDLVLTTADFNPDYTFGGGSHAITLGVGMKI